MKNLLWARVGALAFSACLGGGGSSSTSITPTNVAVNSTPATQTLATADAVKKPFATLVDNNSGDRLTLCPTTKPHTIEYSLTSVAGNPLNDVHLMFNGNVPAHAVDTIVMPTTNGPGVSNGYVVNNIQPTYNSSPSEYVWSFNPATTNAYFIVGPRVAFGSVTHYLIVMRETGSTTYTFEVSAQCSSGITPSPKSW